MTPAEQVEQVRTALAGMRNRLDEKAVTHRQEGDELLLRLTDYAESVLDRHRHRIRNGENWCGAHSHWPCPEVKAVINAWLPWLP